MYRNYPTNRPINVEDITEAIDCPHCAMVYSYVSVDKTKAHRYQYNKKLEEVEMDEPQMAWEIEHPDFEGYAEQLARNVFRCATCQRMFAVNLKNGMSRKLTQTEQSKFGPDKNLNRTFKMSELEAAHLALQQFASIQIMGLDPESGTIFFKDVHGREHQLEILPAILKSFVIDHSSYAKVEEAILAASRLQRKNFKKRPPKNNIKEMDQMHNHRYFG